jgi:hypothetical protein
VLTQSGTERSLNNDGYPKSFRERGAIKCQPGYLVDQILLRVNHLLQEFSRNYPAIMKQDERSRLGPKRV